MISYVWKLFLKIFLPCLILLEFLLPPLHAFEFKAKEGAVTGSFDTTISVGAAWRVEGRDKDLIGIANGGKAQSVNYDDGNRNYSKGLISSTVKATHELEMNYLNYGILIRGSYFYDFLNEDKGELSGPAREKIGKDTELLDAFVQGDFNFDNMPLNMRLGNQVLSWGESTFIQNGINIINPVDLSNLRVPGSEIKEALVPTPILSASIDYSETLNLEAYYQLTFEEIEIDPQGTYFSTSDIVGSGGNTVWLGLGLVPEGTAGAGIPRLPDDHAKDSGQFGIALHRFATLSDTEFGLYYINYHSRLPIVSAKAGTLAGATSGDYPGSMRYFLEYPEDVHLFGLAFNTLLNRSGVALQGEFSYRPNMPLQVDDTELLFAAFTPLNSIAPGSYSSQLGSFDFSDTVYGFKRKKVGQAQVTASKILGPGNPFGAESVTVLAELGCTNVFNMEDKTYLRYLGAVTTPADEFSWGYRIVLKIDYENAIGPVKISPNTSFSHDVNGISPGPGGNFIENRKALSLGIGGSYLERWRTNLSYTRYFGAEDINLYHDRDFVSFDVKYFF